MTTALALSCFRLCRRRPPSFLLFIAPPLSLIAVIIFSPFVPSMHCFAAAFGRAERPQSTCALAHISVSHNQPAAPHSLAFVFLTDVLTPQPPSAAARLRRLS